MSRGDVSRDTPQRRDVTATSRPTQRGVTENRRYTIGALLLGALLAAASLAPSPAFAVIDGEPATSAEAPWAASLMIPGRGRRSHHCTATVIAPRRVLTARHCVEHPDVWQRLVVTGTDAPERAGGSQTRVARVWAPYVFDFDDPTAALNDRDLAVVETVGDLKAPALPLTPAGTALAPDEPVAAYGFGFTNGERNGDETPSLLRRGRMLLYTPAQCAESDFGYVETALCARRVDGPGGGVLSNGDSGGGLVRQGAGGPELLGVNSVGTRGMAALAMSGFASVPAAHGFVTAPETGVELPIPKSRATLSGRARVGARLRCSASFAPRPKVTATSWQFTPRRGRVRFERATGAWKVPASARGGKVACAAYGGLSDDYGSRTEWSRATTVRR